MQIKRICRFRIHEQYIKERYPRFHRLGPETKTGTLLEALQPVPAFVGLVGSLLIVFVFTTATWWDTSADFRKVAPAFGSVRILGSDSWKSSSS